MNPDIPVQVVVLYHGGCRDGFAAAWVCYKVYGDATTKYIPCYYGTEPPYEEIKGKAVVMVDFSYKLPEMQKIAELASRFTVLDHHKTAQETLADFKGQNIRVVFDMAKSGAGIAHDYFYPGAIRPMLIDYVEDRDLWRNELPYTKAVNAYFSVLPFEFEAWDRVEAVSKLDRATYHSWIKSVREAGEYVLLKIAQYVREVAKNARMVTFHGHVVPCVNAPQTDVSELLDHLCIDKPFAMSWWQRADGKFQYSLRSRNHLKEGDDSFDVSELAKLMGGGGHKNAAGFESDHMLVF